MIRPHPRIFVINPMVFNEIKCFAESIMQQNKY